MGKEHSYAVTVRWTGNTGTGTSGYRAYGRGHDVVAEGKPDIHATADPAFGGVPERWNPEDLLVASLSQCHMLTYLALCACHGVVVTGYEDTAHGRMRETPGHSGHFTEVVLNPLVTVADPVMTERAVALHHDAHAACFIANSVNFPVRHEPTVRVAADEVTDQAASHG
ncbi:MULTISPECIES: OsmC family protein [Streptomycetaceae]|uniref:OsmC-like protein n=1 Tax=Streptantibioticus cattleyicolor (strain ATCC 35852 / DSM 46488 / JCM 4925 / NBRC 14057 / NRRL 8057) TaxID=1003195 RepID=F8JZ53_STREN|nr:OsmC family protein [Streptantibioticus cattleyicolor]AEW94719.1 OsmC-like protein [Streptantibioticus cattleyicolor NRRL 8057 = DSM 46488]MYS59350.1 OsmC family peroxiredoxin [Streptomyces sp. SID5468]CCB75075.1 OsmC-like protein [Streptantibioticus cattleyicolor NRRL 8057 = DSM 46488]